MLNPDIWKPYNLVRDSQVCEGFFMKNSIVHVYYFSYRISHIERWLALVFCFFFDFFELVFLNPNPWKPLKTPKTPIKTPHVSGPLDHPWMDGLDQEVGLRQRSAGCAFIGRPSSTETLRTSPSINWRIAALC